MHSPNSHVMSYVFFPNNVDKDSCWAFEHSGLSTITLLEKETGMSLVLSASGSSLPAL